MLPSMTGRSRALITLMVIRDGIGVDPWVAFASSVALPR